MIILIYSLVQTSFFCKFNTFTEHVRLYSAFDDKAPIFPLTRSIFSTKKKMLTLFSALSALRHFQYEISNTNTFTHKKYTHNPLNAIFSQLVKYLFSAFRSFYNQIKKFRLSKSFVTEIYFLYLSIK